MLLTTKSGSQWLAYTEYQLLLQKFGVLNSLLLMQPLFTFLRVQSSQSLNIPVRWRPVVLPVALVVTSEWWPSLAYMMLKSFLMEDLGNWLVSSRNSTLANQLSWVLIMQSGAILPLKDCIMMFFLWSLFMLFPYNCMCSLSILFTWCTFMQSLPFL